MSDRSDHVADVDQKYADYVLLDTLNHDQRVSLSPIPALAYAAWKDAEDLLRAHDDERDH